MIVLIDDVDYRSEQGETTSDEILVSVIKVPILKSRLELKFTTISKFQMKLLRTVLNKSQQFHVKLQLD